MKESTRTDGKSYDIVMALNLALAALKQGKTTTNPHAARFMDQMKQHKDPSIEGSDEIRQLTLKAWIEENRGELDLLFKTLGFDEVDTAFFDKVRK